MSRADRQIERLDRDTLDVLIGGVGGNPKNMGLVAPKDSFAPRIGGVYRLNDETVLRSGYGVTLDARGMSAQEAFRGDFSYPLVLNASFQPPPGTSTFGWYGSLNQGIPLLEGPDLSTRPHPSAERLRDADGGAGIDTPRPYAFLERGGRAPRAVQRVGRRRLCRQQAGRRPAARRSADHQHQQRAAPRRRRRRIARISSRTDVSSTSRSTRPTGGRPIRRMQVGVTRPFTQGLLLKGHYTLSRSKALRTDYELPTPEAQDRNWALANGDRPHTFTWPSSISCHGAVNRVSGSIARILINDWQLNGVFAAFSGSPFTVTADGTTLNTPGNTADCRSRGRGARHRRHRRQRLLHGSRRVGAAGGRALRHQPDRTSSAALAAGTSTCRSSVLSRSARPDGLKGGSKPATSPTRPISATPPATCRAAISCASSGCMVRTPSGRSGWRFATASNQWRRSGSATRNV